MDSLAPPGKIWVCLACGKISEDKYGREGEKTSGWDVSCFINSELFDKKDLVFGENNRVEKVKSETGTGTSC